MSDVDDMGLRQAIEMCVEQLRSDGGIVRATALHQGLRRLRTVRLFVLTEQIGLNFHHFLGTGGWPFLLAASLRMV